MAMFQEAEKSEKGQISVKTTTIHTIGSELEEAHTEIKKAREAKPNNSTTTTDRMETMEENIKTIMEAVTSMTKSKTWAQVAAANADTPNTHLEMAKRERLEKAKGELAKTEIILNFRNATTNMKKQVEETPEKELTKIVQEHVNCNMETPIQLRSIRKLTKQTLKIQCNHESETKALQNIKWEDMEGASIVKPTYGVVVHGVSKSDINPTDQSDAKAALETNNNIKVNRVAPLIKKPRNPEAPTQSIIIFTENPKEGNDLICEGLRVEGRYYAAERYAPQCQIKQCFKCQGYGHKAEMCTKKPRCGKCAQEHETRQCDRRETKCAHCEGPHAAWHHECPHRQKENKRLEVLRATIPPMFAINL